MKQNLRGLDIKMLKEMYEKEATVLKRALLNGASWDDMGDQRRKVTEISIALHKLRFDSNNPAESFSRGSS